MIDILLTHSYHLRFDPKEYRAMSPYPPLGTLYAAAVLRDAGFSVALHDAMFDDSLEPFAGALARHAPRVVAIYDDQFNYLTKMCLTRMREAAFAMSGLAKERGCRVILFSSDASDHIEEYIAHGADYVICGEAEHTLRELAEHLLRGTPASPEGIAGIAWRNGSLRVAPRRAILKELDRLPMPAWEFLDAEAYRSRWRRTHGRFSLNLVTTRGCPFHCNWCAKPIYGQVYNCRSPESVAEEMLYLKRAFRPDHIWIADDIFGLKPGWIASFAEQARAKDAVIPFKCQTRADLLLDAATVASLRESGCESVWLGAESGSQAVLDAMEKGTTTEQIREASRLLHEAGIRVGFFLQFGYPGETRADIDRTLAMVKACRPEEIGISVSYPLPGTKFHERTKERMGEKRNWKVSEDLDLMFPGLYPPDYYRLLHRWTHKKHQIWRGGDLLRGRTRAGGTSAFIRQIAKSAWHGLTIAPLSRGLARMEDAAERR